MNRLQEVEQRLSEIANDIEKRAETLTKEELTVFDAEVVALAEERKNIIEAHEKRQKLLNDIAEGRTGTVIRTFPDPSKPTQPELKEDKLDSLEYRKAFMAYVLRGTPIPMELRANAITMTPDIGEMIPQVVLNKIVETMESVGMILPLVTRTAYKGGLTIPTSTVKPTAVWVAEGAGSDKQKKTTGGIVFAYHKLRCAVAVSLEVDTMAMSAFESTLINNVVEAMTKAIETSIISGTGTGQPKGILSETPLTGRSISSTTPAYQDLVDAEAALPIAYESGAVWCMTKKTFMSYFGLVDEIGQPLGRVNYGIAGKPERFLLGRPVIVCDYVDSYASSLASGKTFAFLFNFKDYILNTNYNMTIKKYEDDETDDYVTKAIMLVDGKVVDKNSLVTIKKG